jgi:hypothetical protein
MIDPRLGEFLGLALISGGRCFVSPGLSGYVREPRPTKSASRRANQNTGDKNQDTAEDDLENCR